MSKTLLLNPKDNSIITIADSCHYVKVKDGEYIQTNVELNAVGILVPSENCVYPLETIRKVVNEMPVEIEISKHCYDDTKGFYINPNWKPYIDPNDKDSELNKPIYPTVDISTCTLDELKRWQISLSIRNLATYLETQPITSTCHKGVEKQYSITKDKQTLLTQMILLSKISLSDDTSFQPSWNATGEECTYDWTLEELQQLAREIESVVRPKISLQQAMEANIIKSTTKQEVLAINVEF